MNYLCVFLAFIAGLFAGCLITFWAVIIVWCEFDGPGIFERIATALETVVDPKKKTLRMVDVERGKVYKTHLGGKLRR